VADEQIKAPLAQATHVLDETPAVVVVTVVNP